MVDHHAGRRAVLAALRAELVGPAPRGSEIDCSTAVAFDTREESYGPWCQRGSREEILQQDRPVKRYGVGVLYPPRVAGDETAGVVMQGPEGDDEGSAPPPVLEDGAANDLERLTSKTERKDPRSADDLEISANSYRPSAMGVSFLAELRDDLDLVVKFTAGRYRPLSVKIDKSQRTWWLRSPVSGRATFPGNTLRTSARRVVPPAESSTENGGGLNLSVVVVVRPQGSSERVSAAPRVLVTVTLVNRSGTPGSLDESCIFQTWFEAFFRRKGVPVAAIQPYPRAPEELLDPEEQEVDLLYRQVRTFGVGHGCAADWKLSASGDTAERLSAECLPAFETSSITPDIIAGDGTALSVRMDALAGLVTGDTGVAALERIVNEYGSWIETRDSDANGLAQQHRSAATRHLDQCRRALARMRRGLELLATDSLVARAFTLANHAMLLQQVRNGSRTRREREWDAKGKRWSAFSEEYAPEAPVVVPSGRGTWRSFQIAFVLMNLPSISDGSDPDRDLVELIWFPTGGGKTEAYLALAAFAIFVRRLRALRDRMADEDAGVEVLMRYTLRLLTSQQFQRATALLCAMEYLRRQPGANLGKRPFKIGLWVGGTPNSRTQAVASFRKHSSNDSDSAEHSILVLDRCPWCRAFLGEATKGRETVLHGYECRASAAGPKTLIVRCPDQRCVFAERLPVEFVDEDIYDPAIEPVSMMIGTVDKFAMLAWRPEARRIFGRGSDGRQTVTPPGLILQDELHLISGPLGSMVALYESVIEELCIDRRNGAVLPKIVTSTATIRSYRAQVRALFARDDVLLFPPPGLEVGDSFFATYARDKATRELLPGRLYVGIHAPGLGSTQTAQVRAFSALLQAPQSLKSVKRDPWWTLLLFYNSIRELGGGLTLFNSDIPEHLEGTRRRLGLDFSEVRRLRRIRELTGRLGDSEVTSAIAELEVTADASSPPIDVCLASSIIEVGVDIDRLSLMAVVGQPKTTAQYIQVTGRIGRRWQERPGLVVTIYAASKPRDRSHFEKFRSYHERLYAQVEPSSVTPFSRPALERALHAALALYVRQTGAVEGVQRPYPFPEKEVNEAATVLRERVDAVQNDDGDGRANLERVLRRRLEEWKRWQPGTWQEWSPRDQDIPLLWRAGQHVLPDVGCRTWMTPTSMRNVDAEAAVRITSLYAVTEVAEGAGDE